VITGSTGFLGWHVAEAFRDAGWRVTGVVRRGSKRPLPPGVEAAEVALDPAALARATEGAAVLVHAAGLTHGRTDRDFHAVNVAGTEAAVAAANVSGARLIFISSQAVIGTGTPDRPSREGDTPRPLNAYGRSKLAAEVVVTSQTRGSWTIVRPSAVYGPRDRQFLPLFRLAARGWFPVVAGPATAFTFAFAGDVARAILLAATGGSERTVFVGHPQPQTTEDVLRGLADVFERPYRPLRLPLPVLGGLAWAGELASRVGIAAPLHRARLVELTAEGFVCATERARDELGFTAAVGLREGLERTARWYRDQGWV
jgi:nucleoside-diphosphate-sugar epimerase